MRDRGIGRKASGCCCQPIRRQVALALATLCFSVSTALAQDVSILRQTWQYFIDRCSLAYADQQRYLDEIAAGKAPSAGNIATTSDGQIIWAGTTGEVLHDTYTAASVGNHRVRHCYVMGLFDDDRETAEELSAVFLGIVAEEPDWALSGGVTTEETGFGNIEDHTYRYSVLGAFPDEIEVHIIIGRSVVEVFSTHIDKG